jgi:hypothetical protein
VHRRTGAPPGDVVDVDLQGGDPVGLGEVEAEHAGVVGVLGRVVQRDDGGEAGQRLAGDGALLQQLHRGVERGPVGAGELVEDQHVAVALVRLGAAGRARARLDVPLPGAGSATGSGTQKSRWLHTGSDRSTTRRPCSLRTTRGRRRSCRCRGGR